MTKLLLADHKFTGQFFIIMMLIASSCLPVQKKTQCGDNEAFDGSRRKCVPVVGAASTGTVFITSRTPVNSYTTNRDGAPVTHQVTISDVYKYGYSVRWYVHYTTTSSTGSVLVATNTSQYTFVPATMYGFYGDGSYQVEAIVYDTDGTEQLDATNWGITLNPYLTPTLTAPSPGGAAFSYPNNTITATHTLDLTNPDNQTGNYYWYIDGVVAASGTFNSGTTGFSHTFNPSSLTNGIHSLELEITDGAASPRTYDSHVWTINVIDPNLPIITEIVDNNGVDIAGNGVIYAINGLAFSANGFLNNETPPVIMSQICVTVDDYDKTTTGTSDVKLRLSINGVPLPFNNSAVFAANQYCFTNVAEEIAAQILTVPDSSITKTFTVSIVNNDGSNQVLESYPINLVIREANIKPQIKIVHNTITDCDTTQLYNTTGCTQTQSLDANNDQDFADANDVSNSVDYNILVSDTDIDFSIADSYDVLFELRPVGGSFDSLDAIAPKLYTRVDCKFDSVVPANAVAATNQVSCPLDIEAFADSGTVAPGDYVLAATVTDHGSPYDVTQKVSNTVTWTITVTEYQSGVTAPVTANKTAITAITTADAGNTCGAVDAGDDLTIQEGQYMDVTVTVRDYERDSIGTIILYLENQIAGLGSYQTIGTFPSPSITYNAVPNDETGNVTFCVLVPEWAVAGVASRNVGIQAIARDTPDAETPTTSDVFADVANITNNNHLTKLPYFSDAATEDFGVVQHTVFSGYQFHITAPTLSDDSIYGGTTILWKWQVSQAGAALWNDIPQANSTDTPTSADLYWTPTPETLAVGDSVDFRLCIGDDGYGNPADCSIPGLVKTYENLDISPSSNQLTAHTIAGATASAGTEVASWYDSTQKNLYVAFINGTDIWVEKTDYSDSTTITVEHTIKFPAQDPSLADARAAQDLKLVGVDGQYLFVIYTVKNATGYNALRVRRIDLSLNGNTQEAFGFNYTGIFPAVPNPADDLYTGFTGLTIAVASENDSDLTVSITAPPDGASTLSFRDPVNGAVTITEGVEYCNPACATEAAAAQSINDYINTTTTFFGGTLVAEWPGTGGNTTVTIRSNNSLSYFDDDSVHATKLGEPVIYNGTHIAIPYIDGFRTDSISLYYLGDYTAADDGDFTFGSGSLVAQAALLLGTDLNFSDVANDLDSTGVLLHILAKGADGNLDLYQYNMATTTIVNTYNDIISSSVSSGYNELLQISMDMDADDNIMVSGVSWNTPSMTYNLVAGSIASDLASNQFAISSFSDFVDLIDQAKIAAGTTAGEGIIAFTTATPAVPTGVDARVIKVTATLTGAGTGVTAIAFPNEDTWVPPVINPVDPTYGGGAISLTPVFAVDLGNTDNSNLAAPLTQTQNSVFFTYHQDVGGDGTGSASIYLRTSVINIDESSIPTTDGTTTYAYPPFVKNQ